MNNDVVVDITSDDGTERLGILSVSVPDRPDLGGVFSCNTLELPYKDNQRGESSIPTGKYRCVFTKSARLTKLKGSPVYTYEVLNVPNRTGIRIHSANFFSDLEGCIALGDELVDINKDGNLDIKNSRNTITIFNAIMQKQPFNLIIQGGSEDKTSS